MTEGTEEGRGRKLKHTGPVYLIMIEGLIALYMLVVANCASEPPASPMPTIVPAPTKTISAKETVIAQRSQIIYATATARAAPRATSEAAQATATSLTPRATISAKETVIAQRSQIIHATATARALSRISTPTSTSVPLAYGAGPASPVWKPPTVIPQSAGVRPASTAASATARARSAPTAIPKPAVSAAECRKWFEDFRRDHLLNLADLETIADMLNPEGSYYHYYSDEERHEAVDFQARFLHDRVLDIRTYILPARLPGNIRIARDNYAHAYIDFSVLIINEFDGDIFGARWLPALL